MSIKIMETLKSNTCEIFNSYSERKLTIDIIDFVLIDLFDRGSQNYVKQRIFNINSHKHATVLVGVAVTL
jgi:hypothetical protein